MTTPHPDTSSLLFALTQIAGEYPDVEVVFEAAAWGAASVTLTPHGREKYRSSPHNWRACCVGMCANEREGEEPELTVEGSVSDSLVAIARASRVGMSLYVHGVPRLLDSLAEHLAKRQITDPEWLQVVASAASYFDEGLRADIYANATTGISGNGRNQKRAALEAAGASNDTCRVRVTFNRKPEPRRV